MPKWIRRLFHRHTWKVLKTEYWYPDPRRYKRSIAVRRCQCRDCGKIEYIHFDEKHIVY